MAAEETVIPTVKLNNGASMPMVGLGTWRSKPGEVTEAVYYAIKNGYRHIDCAHCYGNEGEVGEGIARALQEGCCTREELFITSKLWSNSHHADDVEPAMDVTLTNLKLTYVDLYLIHWPTNFQRGENPFPKDEEGRMLYGKPEEDYRQTWPSMEALVNNGKARAIGLSNFNTQQIEYILENSEIKPAVLQIECHPYCTQEVLKKYCDEKNIVITAYSPLGSPGRSWENSSDPSLLEDEKIKEIANRLGKTNAQVLIRFSIDRGMVVIPKSVTPSRILSNFDVANFSLSEEDVKTLLSYNKNWHAVVPQIEVKEKQRKQKVLLVATSASKMGEHATGAWSEELTGAYYEFLDANCDVYISSVKGGKIPIDQGSLTETFKTENDERFLNDEAAVEKLNNSIIFSECDPAEFDAVWFAGGHGTCVDFADVGELVSQWWASEKVIGSVCHGQTCLVNAMEVDGKTPLVKNKRITSFTDVEEVQVGLAEKVPFLLESKLKELGCKFVNGDPWSTRCERDGNLITGQNPQSTVAAAKLVVKALCTTKKVPRDLDHPNFPFGVDEEFVF